MAIRTRLFDYNPNDRTATWWHYDDADDSVTIQTNQNSAPLLEMNYERRKELTGVQTKHGDGDHLVAELPMALLYKLKETGDWEPSDPKGTRLLKWLRDHKHEWMCDPRRYV